MKITTIGIDLAKNRCPQGKLKDMTFLDALTATPFVGLGRFGMRWSEQPDTVLATVPL